MIEKDVIFGGTEKLIPLILGSSWDIDVTEKIKGLHLSVSLPITDRLILHHTYVGYRGGLNLVEDIYSKLLSLQI